MTGNQEEKKENNVRTTMIHVLKLADKNFKVTLVMCYRTQKKKNDKMNKKQIVSKE